MRRQKHGLEYQRGFSRRSDVERVVAARPTLDVHNGLVHQELYGAAAVAVLTLHLAWLFFVALGAFFTAKRPWLTAAHIVALGWGIAVEVGPWPCPLTALEQHLQARAGMTAYTQSFLAHWLDRLVYPDIPESVLVTGAVAVCGLNIAAYVRRYLIRPGSASPDSRAHP